MRKKRVTYRPGKTAGAFGVIWGSIFILIGVFVVIPTFGPFGILWTLMAVGITAYNGYCAFGKGYHWRYPGYRAAAPGAAKPL